MKRCLALAVVSLLFAPVAAPAADDMPIERLLGKWELTEKSAGIPKGAVFDFQRGGKLVVNAVINGKEVQFEFGYELKEKERTLRFATPDKSDTTKVVYERDRPDEFTCQDKDGTTAKFKRK